MCLRMWRSWQSQVRSCSNVQLFLDSPSVSASVTQLYAFHYIPNPPLFANDGWSLYSPREEFGRMGVGARTRAWRFTDINKDYSVCLSKLHHPISDWLTEISYVHHIPHVWWFRQKSVMRHCNMLRNIAANAEYPFLLTCTGRTTWVLFRKMFCLELKHCLLSREVSLDVASL